MTDDVPLDVENSDSLRMQDFQKLGLFLIGTINNLPYVIVNSAASSIARSYNELNNIGLIFGANVALAVVVKSLNTFVLLRVSYTIRFLINGSLMLIGLFGVAYSFNFGFALACIVILGCSASFGENVALGYLSQFPSKMINAWSSGTGMAGLMGAGLYVLFGCVVATDKMKQLNKMAFLLTTPVVLLYWVSYFFIIKVPPKSDNPNSGTIQQADEENVDQDQPDVADKQKLLPPVTPVSEPVQPVETAFRRVVRCFRLSWWMSFNLCAVYIFEYVARACAAKVRPASEYNHGCPELYAAFQLCYQAGVFVSRSSVQLVKIPRVGILSLLQFFNMLLWIFDVHYKFIPVYLLPVLMVYVGLLGGASYVNIFYQILHSRTLTEKDRELSMNITGLFITLGIVLGTAVDQTLFHTFLKND